MGKNLAAMAGQVEADIGFVEVAADPDLGILDHVAGHQGFIFQQERDEVLTFLVVLSISFSK